LSDGLVRRVGEQLTAGALRYLSLFALVITLLLIVFALARDLLEIGVDDSDTSARERSGLAIHTDAKTGVQYVSTPGGGLHVRVDADGKPITSPK
jgi:hypothetical protein